MALSNILCPINPAHGRLNCEVDDSHRMILECRVFDNQTNKFCNYSRAFEVQAELKAHTEAKIDPRTLVRNFLPAYYGRADKDEAAEANEALAAAENEGLNALEIFKLGGEDDD